MKKPSLAKLAGILGIAFATAAAPTFPADANTCRGPQGSSTLVIDFNTGVVLRSHNPAAQRIPASLTKLMTLTLAMEALDSGKIKETDIITISRNAVAGNLYDNRTPVYAGDRMSVREVISGLVILSSNKLSIALAEHIAGSEQNFVRMMNSRAKTIGMNNTVFTDSHGLEDNRQTTTAYDMARLLRHIIKEHDNRLSYFNSSEFSHRGITRRGGSNFTNAQRDVDISKTGYVCKSGFNLVASSVKDGRRIIGVVFGYSTAWQRDRDMRAILDQAHRDAPRIISATTSSGQIRKAP